MSKNSTSWFAVMAAVGLTISLVQAGTVVAQPPGRGPGGQGFSGPGGPGRGGPPNVAEMFSRMDKNNDGKLTKDEVPEPMWARLSHTDANHDGGVTKDEAAKGLSDRRPDGAPPEGGRPDDARPDASPSDRPREDQPRSRGPHPPMEQPRDESSRGPDRGPRDASPYHNRPTPSHSPGQPTRQPNARPDNAQRGPSPFGPDAFFDRLDKNNDGQLSRDEFQAVAALHQSPRASRGPWDFSGPGGPPSAHRGPAMRGGGPPWAHSTRANFPGPHWFQGGPPWARPGHGPSVHGKFAGPPWPHADQQRRGPQANKERAEHGDKANQAHKSDPKSSHDGVKDHRKHAKPDKAKGHAEHGRKPDKGKRSDNDHGGPRDGDRASSQQPNEELMANDLQSTSPSESHVATLPL